MKDKREMKLTSKVTAKEHERIELAADRMHMTVSSFVRHVMLEYIGEGYRTHGDD